MLTYFYFLLLIINIYNVFCFNNIMYSKFRLKKTALSSNKYNIFYKNNSGILPTENYLESLETKRKNVTKKNLIKKTSFDNILLYNNYIDITYYDDIKNFVIIEFKNKTKRVYYYNNNHNHISEIIDKIDSINLNDYPSYILNTPFGFLLCEKNK
jgi:hypothetical protein